jgi:hypothetical protein
MKMHDIGQGRERPEAVEAPELHGKTYPTINFRESQAPFIKDWPTGEEYTMTIVVKKTGEHESQPWDYGADKSMFHEFEIRKAGYDGQKDKTQT